MYMELTLECWSVKKKEGEGEGEEDTGDLFGGRSEGREGAIERR